MTKKPTYEELAQRVAALEARQDRFPEMQAERTRSLNFTESLLAALPTPVFWKDADGRYGGCNAAFTEIMGVSADQIRGKTVHELWPGRHARIYHEKDLELLQNPEPQVYSFEVKDKLGEVRPVIYYKNAFRDESGSVAGIVGGFVDISEEVHAVETLRSQRSLLNSLFDSLPLGITVWAADSRLLMVNRGFTELTGYTGDELSGLDDWFSLAFPEPEYRRSVKEDWRAFRERSGDVREYRMTCRDGTVKDVECSGAILPDGRSLVALADLTERRQAMEERESYHRLLQSVLDAVPDLLIVVDRDFRIRYANDKGHDLIHPLEGELGRTCHGRFKRLAAPCPDCSAAPVFAEGKRVEREMVNPADGRIREVRAFPIFDTDGRVSHAVEYVRDITEIRRAQEEISSRQEFLESVLYHAPDAIVTLDERHRVLDWNPGAVKMFGYSPGEAIGFPLDDLVAPGGSHAEAGGKTAQVLSGRRVEAFETVRYRKDGTPVHVIAAGSPILVDGVLKGVVAVYTDITERVRNEEALRTSHQRFITVLDSIDATIYVADMETREILFMNQHMVVDFGGDRTGQICWKAFRNRSAPCPHCTNDRLVDDEGKPTGVLVWQGKNPVSGKWCINYDRAIEWTDGRIVRLQIATDITEHKKMEDALRKAQKMEAVGTLASGIAHDFNNLLMGIQGCNSLISVDLDPAHPHAEHTAAIEEYIRSAVSLTKQLLGLVRGGKYEVKPIDIHELLETTAAMFGRTRKQVRIRIRAASEPAVVEADKRQIEQVLLNVYVNAWQAMPDGGDLYIDARLVELSEEACRGYSIPAGRYVKIALTDTGVGMTEETQRKVFDPFFTTKEKGRGTGLGLASAYGIIRNHGGTITVYSEVGHGSTFNIYLPSSPRTAVPDKPSGGPLVGGTETVLLVDDEAMIVEVGKAMLERLGYRVVSAGGGAEAVARLTEQQDAVDLVILDLVMPGIDGGQTFDRIRKLRPSMPVILSSGYSINGQAAEIMDRGCNGFLQKPFHISELAQMIRRVLDAVPDAG